MIDFSAFSEELVDILEKNAGMGGPAAVKWMGGLKKLERKAGISGAGQRMMANLSGQGKDVVRPTTFSRPLRTDYSSRMGPKTVPSFPESTRLQVRNPFSTGAPASFTGAVPNIRR